MSSDSFDTNTFDFSSLDINLFEIGSFDKKNEFYEAFQKQLIDESVPDGELKEMMEYSLFAGGKRFRPLLLLRSFIEISHQNRLKVTPEQMKTVMQFAVAVECIHTYSLIHDDLPCMDDDDFRRGMPTSHVKYGEAEALLAGDALLNLGFEIMSNAALQSETKHALKALNYIGRSTGAGGMVLGQYFDIKNIGEITTEQLDRINFYKTSALIRASIVAGVILGAADEHQIAITEGIGDDIGRIFQLTDDLIDINSTLEISGKSVGSDKDAHKVTYPMLLGEERVRRIILNLAERTEKSAQEIGLYFIQDIVGNLIDRKR